MTKAQVVEVLLRANSHADRSQVAMYADLFIDYRIAQRNIDANGTVCMHPKTGAPIVNPFLAVRDSTMARLLRFDLETGGLWGTDGS